MTKKKKTSEKIESTLEIVEEEQVDKKVIRSIKTKY